MGGGENSVGRAHTLHYNLNIVGIEWHWDEDYFHLNDVHLT
jgi:hypothetical protein